MQRSCDRLIFVESRSVVRGDADRTHRRVYFRRRQESFVRSAQFCHASPRIQLSLSRVEADRPSRRSRIHPSRMGDCVQLPQDLDPARACLCVTRGLMAAEFLLRLILIITDSW